MLLDVHIYKLRENFGGAGVALVKALRLELSFQSRIDDSQYSVVLREYLNFHSLLLGKLKTESNDKE